MKASYLKTLLPLRDIVIFPSMVVPLFVGRDKSIKALQEVMKSDKSIVLITQKNSEIDDPTSKDLFQYGCLSKVLQLLKLPDGTVKVLVEGEKRVKILKHNDNSPSFLTCEVEIVDDQNKNDSNYVRMSNNFDNSIAFQTACDLVFKGKEQPSGYTEPLLHLNRLTKKSNLN